MPCFGCMSKKKQEDPTAKRRSTAAQSRAAWAAAAAQGECVEAAPHGKKKGIHANKAGGRLNQRRVGAQKLHRGRLFIRLSVAEDALTIQVEEVRDFHTLGNTNEANAYVSVSLNPAPKGKDIDSYKRKTSIVKGAKKRAVFEETFVFDISSIQGGARDSTRLRLELLHDLGKKKSQPAFLGLMSFTITEIEDEDTPTDGWFRFLDEKKGVNQNEPFRVMRKRELAGHVPKSVSAIQDNNQKQQHQQGDDDTPIIGKQLASDQDKLAIGSFKYLHVLGRGAFGKVLLAERKGTDEIYAVKVLSKEEVIDDDDVEATMAERRVLAIGSECSCLTGLFATFQSLERLYFVMEFVSGGDLMFHASKVGKFKEEQAQLLLAEIACGLWFLHEHGIIYRDLKLDNVMLTGEGHAKITDFGLCKEGIWGAATTTTFCGTPGYLAPEIIQELPYGPSVDWWSFGVLAYELLLGTSPFEGDDEEEIFEEVLNAPIKFDASMSDTAKTFVSALLTRDHSQRLGCTSSGKNDLQAHKFFEGLDWEAVAKHQVPPRYLPASTTDPRATDNFDQEFTGMSLTETPVDTEAIEDIDQELFTGFSFVASSGDKSEMVRPPLQEYPWYHPELDRNTAETFLQDNEVGKFIVRESGSQPGCYAITVKFKDRCWHGVITPGKAMDGTKFFRLYPKAKFADIPSLVQHYHTSPIARDADRQNVVLVFEGEEDE